MLNNKHIKSKNNKWKVDNRIHIVKNTPLLRFSQLPRLLTQAFGKSKKKKKKKKKKNR